MPRKLSNATSLEYLVPYIHDEYPGQELFASPYVNQLGNLQIRRRLQLEGTSPTNQPQKPFRIELKAHLEASLTFTVGLKPRTPCSCCGVARRPNPFSFCIVPPGRSLPSTCASCLYRNQASRCSFSPGYTGFGPKTTGREYRFLYIPKNRVKETAKVAMKETVKETMKERVGEMVNETSSVRSSQMEMPALRAKSAAVMLLPYFDESFIPPRVPVGVYRALANRLPVRPMIRNDCANRTRRGATEFKIHRMNDLESGLIYLTGVVAPSPCGKCKNGCGPLRGCIITRPEDGLPTSCSNCIYQSRGASCTFYTPRIPRRTSDLPKPKKSIQPSRPDDAPTTYDHEGTSIQKKKQTSSQIQVIPAERPDDFSEHEQSQQPEPQQPHAAEGLLTLRIGQLRHMNKKERARVSMEVSMWKAAFSILEAEMHGVNTAGVVGDLPQQEASPGYYPDDPQNDELTVGQDGFEDSSPASSIQPE